MMSHLPPFGDDTHGSGPPDPLADIIPTPQFCCDGPTCPRCWTPVLDGYRVPAIYQCGQCGQMFAAERTLMLAYTSVTKGKDHAFLWN